MKILFIDEIKDFGLLGKKTLHKGYGLICTLIDAQYYRELNEKFVSHLKEFPGYQKTKEIKGKSLFSGTNVEKNVEVMGKILSLSSSKSSKTSKFQTYVYFDFFDKNMPEQDCYMQCLRKIINKITKNNKGKKKSLVMLVADENNCFGKSHDLFDNGLIAKDLLERNYFLFEKCYFVSSDNLTIGILFSDYTGYVLRSFMDFDKFNKQNKDRIVSLINTEKLSENEQKELSHYLNTYKKRDVCLSLLFEVKKRIII